jgi:hypothetical protein
VAATQDLAATGAVGASSATVSHSMFLTKEDEAVAAVGVGAGDEIDEGVAGGRCGGHESRGSSMGHRECGGRRHGAPLWIRPPWIRPPLYMTPPRWIRPPWSSSRLDPPVDKLVPSEGGMRHREGRRQREVVAAGMRERWRDYGLRLDMLVGFVGRNRCIATNC